MVQCKVAGDYRRHYIVFSGAILLFVLLFLNEAFAAGPIPYSREALVELNNSAGKLGSVIPPVGATKGELFEVMVEFYTKLFSKAGYNFEKSIVQLSQDLSKDPAFPAKVAYVNTPVIQLYTMSRQLNEARKDVSIKPAVDKSLSKETIVALDKILLIENQQIAAQKAEDEKRAQAELAEKGKIIKENEANRIKEIEAAKQQDKIDFEVKKIEMDANVRIQAAETEKRKEQAKQQNELALNEKQNALKALNGRYENKQGKRLAGYIDVKVVSDDKVSFSLSNENFDLSCKIVNKEANISYNSPRDIKVVFGDLEEAAKNKNACAVTIAYDGDSLVIENSPRCPDYCQRGGSMTGRYKQI